MFFRNTPIIKIPIDSSLISFQIVYLLHYRTEPFELCHKQIVTLRLKIIIPTVPGIESS